MKRFEVDESTFEFMFPDNEEPAVVTVSGRATGTDESSLRFTQSFKLGPRAKGWCAAEKLGDVDSVIEHFAFFHIKLMICK